jgi:hypothetical protein
MKSALTVLQIGILLDAVVLVVLGILFWTGNALTLIPLHMLLGLLFVLGLWIMAVLGLKAGVPRGLVVVAIVWGLVVVWFGLNQDSLVPGDLHWLIRVLHLLVGVAAVGLAEALAGRARRATASS